MELPSHYLFPFTDRCVISLYPKGRARDVGGPRSRRRTKKGEGEALERTNERAPRSPTPIPPPPPACSHFHHGTLPPPSSSASASDPADSSMDLAGRREEEEEEEEEEGSFDDAGC